MKKVLVCIGSVLVAALLFASIPALADQNRGQGMSLAEARQALQEEIELMPGFAGIAHSEERGEITLFLEDEEAAGRAPRRFEDWPVQVEVTGRFYALSAEVLEPTTSISGERRDEVRPLVGGISVGAQQTGTLGMVTYDGKLLSNAHVIAMDGNEFLEIGTPIIQPGRHDGGTWAHRVGALEQYIPIEFGLWSTNFADAAIGSIDAGIEASPGEQFDEGGNYWIAGWTEVSVGDIVRKSGRTTGVTTGEVVHVNASIRIWYAGIPARFFDVILVRMPFSEAGDSGSAVDKDGEFVGLVFARNIWNTRAVICKAVHIIDGLGIAVDQGVKGLVYDAYTGWPLGGIEVEVHETGQVAYTDSGGSYEILVVEPGTYTLTASHPMYHPRTHTVEVAQGEFTTRNFALVPLYPGFPIPEHEEVSAP